MAKKLKSLTRTEAVQAVNQALERKEEQITGVPSPETNDLLNEDEEARPLIDADIFAYCENEFISKNEAVTYLVEKDFGLLCSENHPCSWEKIQKKHGGGRYTIKARHQKGFFVKQETKVLHALPEEEDDSPAFQFAGGGGSGSPTSTTELLALLEQMNARQESARREDRERMMSTLTTLAGTLGPLLAPLLQRGQPQIDPTTSLMLEFIKESNRSQQEQTKVILEEIKQRTKTPEEKPFDMMEYLKRMEEMRKAGREEMKELIELAESKAETRAAELLAEQSEKEESTTDLLIKTMIPALGQVLTQRVALPASQPALPIAENPAPRSVSAETLSPAPEHLVNPPPRAATPVTPVRASQPVKTARVLKTVQEPPARDKEVILKWMIPFFSEQLTRLASGAQIDPKRSAEEALSVLREKGFKREVVLKNFSWDDIQALITQYQLPEAVVPWFRDFYTGLSQTSQTTSPVIDASLPPPQDAAFIPAEAVPASH